MLGYQLTITISPVCNFFLLCKMFLVPIQIKCEYKLFQYPIMQNVIKYLNTATYICSLSFIEIYKLIFSDSWDSF